MTPAGPRKPDRPSAEVSPEVVDALRAELDGLVDDIAARIRRTVLEYADRDDESRDSTLHDTIETAAEAFVDRLVSATPDSYYRLLDSCHRLGYMEAKKGRDLGPLHSAYRTGVHVAWERLMETGRREDFSVETISSLTTALFRYIDELCVLSLEGHRAATRRPAEEKAKARRRLLRGIVKGIVFTPRELAELAGPAEWDVPEQVTPVAVQAGGRYAPEELDADVLDDLGHFTPRLLLPGPSTEGREAMLAAALPECRAVIGPTVPLVDAPDALRWARKTLDLALDGAIDGERLMHGDDHLTDVWLMSDTALIDEIAQRSLTPLTGMTPTQRGRVTTTLRAWLGGDGNAVEVARRLNVHPQTVRYRMRQIKQVFGARLTDPDGRFSLDLVLRVRRLMRRPDDERDDDGTVPPSEAR